MTIIETAKITSKGQVTIPNQIRKLLRLENGASVAFGLSKGGVVLMPCEVTAKSPYTAKEWEKIERLAAENGKIVSSPEAAKAHLFGL
jgi:AbrB family looped-hinge helix DNA binding protein